MNENIKIKLALTIRIGLGLLLFLFGLDKLYAFMPHPVSSTEGIAFKSFLKNTGYMFKLVGITEIVAGLFLFIPQLTKIGILILAPLVINFILYHLFLEIENIFGALIILVGFIYLVSFYFKDFKELLRK